MNTHKISIVIPVYNDGEFIKDCLESVLLQNYKNFEIICVNDGSTDNTLDVLNEYAKKDERVIVIDKKVNEGTMLARKSGAEIATGSYITFIDCDDVIAEDFLYYINESINKYNADIMHFNIAVQDFFHNNGKIERKHSLCPINKTLNSTKEILRYTYLERKIHTALLGKAFRSEVCKKAFSQLPYEKNHVGEDVFSYLYLAYYANTYKGVCEIDKDLYIYRYGLGVSNSETMSLSKFEIYCKMSCWDKYAYEFAKNQPDNEYLIKAIESMAKRLFHDCCSIYRRRTPKENQRAAAAILAKYWKDSNLDEDAWLVGVYESKERFLAKYGESVVLKERCSNDVKISVVVTLSEDVKCFEKCLDGILKQKFNDIEVILVTADKAAAKNIIEDDRIKIIEHKYGDAAARRNAGILNARGEYIIFADENDFLNAESLGRLYDVAAEENLDVLFFENREYTEDALNSLQASAGSVAENYKIYTGVEYMHLAYIKDIHKNSCYGQMIKLSYLKDKNFMFLTGISKEEDAFVPLIMFNAGRCAKIPDVVYLQRKTEKTKNLLKEFESHYMIYNTLISAFISSEYVFEPLLMTAEKEYNICRRIHRKLSKNDKYEIIRRLPKDYKLIFEKSSFDHQKPNAVSRFVQCIREQGIRYSIELLFSMLKNR